MFTNGVELLEIEEGEILDYLLHVIENALLFAKLYLYRLDLHFRQDLSFERHRGVGHFGHRELITRTLTVA